MSQYFSRLAARSGVAETAPSRLPRPSDHTANASWGEQSTEVIVGNTALSDGNTASARAENNIDAGMALSNQPNPTTTKKLAVENKKNAADDIDDSNAAVPTDQRTTANAISANSESAIVDKQYVAATFQPLSSAISEKTATETASDKVFKDAAYTSHSSISNASVSASSRSDSFGASPRKHPLPHAETQPVRKKNVVSRAQKEAMPDAGEKTMAYSEHSIATESFKSNSRFIEMTGNIAAERTSSRPSDRSAVSEHLATPLSRQATQIHIGKIELEIHAAAPKATRPVPAQASPAPAATTKRSAGFSASRHYLRSR